ncbi:hypothetical protein DFH09DRAFT_1096450 [Mycena vulgaris]|nr:hypothetical protein DFH09DRAFT_1096450 [Mycena vulgaris]
MTVLNSLFGNLFALKFPTQIDWSVYRQVYFHRQTVTGLLRMLALNWDSLTSYAKFLHSFVLPSLQDLALSQAAYDRIPFVTAPVSPVLQRISIDCRCHPGPTVPWLRTGPSTIDVWLSGYETWNATVSEMAAGSLLPRVEILVMLKAGVAVLIAVLQTRQSSLDHSTITEVDLTFPCEAGNSGRGCTYSHGKKTCPSSSFDQITSNKILP